MAERDLCLGNVRDRKHEGAPCKVDPDEAATLMRKTFFVREDAYGFCAPEWLKGRTKMGRVTAALLRKHLGGADRVGAHSTDENHQTRWLVIDIDGVSVAAAVDILAVASKQGVPIAVEASKSLGRFHLWVFFDQLVPAWKARALGRALVTAAGWGQHPIEVFPKQDYLSETAKGLGNYVWLPWYGQSLPLGRTAFLDVTQNQWPPYTDQVSYLKRVERIGL